MANRYEIREDGTNKVLMCAGGNLAADAFFDQHSRTYIEVRTVRNARQDEDFNNVHVIYVAEAAA
jgi:hypothetical protein